MTSTLYIDCVGGVAGDMLLSALVDAGASLEAILSRLPVLGVGLETRTVERHGIGATALTVTAPHEHAHRRLNDIKTIIDSSSMPERVKARAHRAFDVLAVAEGRVHRISPDEVTFHEVGALDAIVDICGVAMALEQLDVDDVVCSPLPMGHGTTRSAHGVIPLPAPATLEILRDSPVYGVDVKGETVTPTGAALVKSLSSRFGAMPAMALSRIGIGSGNADWQALPNVVRALLGTADEEQRGSGRAALILETNLDDMVPEWVPDVVQACLDAGAHDAWTTPAGMKNGRPGITLSALVSTSSERSVAHAILRHTTTLGVRARRVEHRWALERRFKTVTVDGHEISVKFGILDGETVNAKPEHRDCVRVAQTTGRSVKSVWVQALASAQSELMGDATSENICPTESDLVED
jgi:pyridinium-3,5-bisthiocarboxylic acid mononucleotide nickel chelatase